MDRRSLVSADTFRRLIEEARQGSPEAFTALVCALQPHVVRWALTFASDADQADDIAQETFVAMYRSLGQFRGETAIEAWLYGITRRTAATHHRGSTRRNQLHEANQSTSPGAYHTDPGSRIDRQRAAAVIREYFEDLPPRQREMFDLVDLQGYEPQEAAILTKTNPATVRAHLFKARSAIRARMLAQHPAEFDR